MTITAKVIEDSVMNGVRLTTLQLEYPRFIHAEFMTHRVFSRNASSSRAIPVDKLVRKALDDPAFFVEVGRNQPGMQAEKLVSDDVREKFQNEWDELARVVAEWAMRWSKDYNIHKQVVNRVMEPWHHICVVVTATEWSNFFELRNHPDAQPEIRALAIRMKEAMDASVPVHRHVHLPYVTNQEKNEMIEQGSTELLFKLSTARCARVSYMNHDGTKPSFKKDVELHDALVGQVPLHASPAEHSAVAWKYTPHIMTSNFRPPWVQYRRYIERNLVPELVV